ncbi:hypothetical protein HanHA300_Chr03g0102871 [Helianthus annuus]|nr:hypothetical protein HanHA300_Chr03g0102871 [Helianthus annuus]KAJ0608949.1 hypothetical protein HanHA89_Chr03g0114551 [Helianthus annuus]
MIKWLVFFPNKHTSYSYLFHFPQNKHRELQQASPENHLHLHRSTFIFTGVIPEHLHLHRNTFVFTGALPEHH